MIIKKIHILYLFRGGVLIYAVHCIYIYIYILVLCVVLSFETKCIFVKCFARNVQASLLFGLIFCEIMQRQIISGPKLY